MITSFQIVIMPHKDAAILLSKNVYTSIQLYVQKSIKLRLCMCILMRSNPLIIKRKGQILPIDVNWCNVHTLSYSGWCKNVFAVAKNSLDLC